MTVHIIQQGTYKGYNHKTLQHDEQKTSINITVVKELRSKLFCHLPVQIN